MLQYPNTALQPNWLAARRITKFLAGLRRSATVLHLGAGGKRIENAINCDLFDPAADRRLDATNLQEIPDGTIDIVEHHHLIEHLSVADLRPALEEWARVLKPNGRLIVSAPDLEMVIRGWLKMSDDERWGYGIKMIYGSQEHDGMFHKNGFTPEHLAQVLRPAGFQQEWFYRGYPRRPTPSFIAIARKRAQRASGDGR